MRTIDRSACGHHLVFIRLIPALLVALCLPTILPAQDATEPPLRAFVDTPTPGRVAIQHLEDGVGIDGYTVYLPLSYDTRPEHAWPVIVYLNGGLAVGGEISVLHNWDMPQMLLTETDLSTERNRLILDTFVIVLPHLTGAEGRNQFYDNVPELEQILDRVTGSLRVDADRIHCTGLSRGGHGTWGVASRIPERFASAAPIGGDTGGVLRYSALADLPIWVIHNARDQRVFPTAAFRGVAWIEKLAGARFLELDRYVPDPIDITQHTRILTAVDATSHDAWSPMFEEGTAIYRWFLAQHRSRRAAVSPPERVRL